MGIGLSGKNCKIAQINENIFFNFFNNLFDFIREFLKSRGLNKYF